MAKLEFSEIIGLGDEVMDAVSKVKGILDTAKAARDEDSEGGAEISEAEREQIIASANAAIDSLQVLIAEVVKEATD